MTVSFAKISVGSLWSRPNLAQHWGYRAFQALARGVVTPANDNKIILFVTEEKQASATKYEDVLEADILKWEGPNDHFAEERMINANDLGEEIHLFHRHRHHTDFEYRGEVKVLSVDRRSSAPTRFALEILDPVRQDWKHDHLLAAFYLYTQLRPGELQAADPAVSRFAESVRKPKEAVAAKLRALAQLDPILALRQMKATDNVTLLDRAVWSEFQNDWTNTTLKACEAYDSVVGAYMSQIPTPPIGAADAQYLFEEGQTREAIVEIRRNQYVFRNAILSSYNSTCCITGLTNARLLIASHIVPWALDTKNRLNPENGLCLSALHDRAYDQGLITVLPDYSIRVSQQLKDQKGSTFLSDALVQYDAKRMRMPGRFGPNPEFLRHHAVRFGFIGR